MKNLKAGIGGALLALVAVVGFCAATSATAQAQYRQYPNDGDGQYRRDRHRDDDRRDRDRDRARRDRRHDRRDDRHARHGDYGNYGNNGRNNNAYRTILNQGYQNGLSTGASDADRGQSYNPQRSHYYREATRNNNDRQYAQAYRDGFVQGYEAGFRRYSDSRDGGYRRSNSSSGIGSILGGILGQP